MQNPVLFFVRPGAIAALTKAHVKGYTRKDGVFVQEHDDKRQKAAQAAVVRPAHVRNNNDLYDHLSRIPLGKRTRAEHSLMLHANRHMGHSQSLEYETHMADRGANARKEKEADEDLSALSRNDLHKKLAEHHTRTAKILRSLGGTTSPTSRWHKAADLHEHAAIVHDNARSFKRRGYDQDEVDDCSKRAVKKSDAAQLDRHEGCDHDSERYKALKQALLARHAKEGVSHAPADPVAERKKLLAALKASKTAEAVREKHDLSRDLSNGKTTDYLGQKMRYFDVQKQLRALGADLGPEHKEHLEHASHAVKQTGADDLFQFITERHAKLIGAALRGKTRIDKFGAVRHA